MGSSITVSGGMTAGDIVLAFSDSALQAICYVADFEIIKSLVPTGHDYRGGRKDSNSSASGSTCNSFKTCSVPEHFSEWLENGGGIFWISGGLVCGKSTFTRHLSSCTNAKDRLLTWSGILPLVDIFCVSQNPDTRTQYSINNLLNTIACQISKRHLELVAVAFPDQWVYMMRTWSRPPGVDSITRKDLSYAVKSLALLGHFDTSFCFFIDGLDQYKDYERGTLALLKHLSTSPCLKFCITSRLDSMNSNASGFDQSRRLHPPDYTIPSIHKHISKNLADNSWIVQHQCADPFGHDKVFDDIRMASRGSFTWIDLALSAALSGMKIPDDLGDLLARLKEFPTDLARLFLHILNGVQDELQDRQARILLIASQAQEPLNVLAFSFLDESDPDFVLRRPAMPMDQKEVESRSRLTKMIILSLSRGILEVVPPGENSSKELVTFSHNSMRNYVCGVEAREILTQRLRSPFNPQKTICEILLARIKFHQMGPFWEEGGLIHDLVLKFLEEVRLYEVAKNDVLGMYINELEKVVCQRKGRTFWWWQKRSIEKGETTSTFLELMIRCRLVGYLSWRFKHCPNLIPGPLEMANLLESTLIPPVEAQVNSNMVKAFLDHGADPNYLSDHGYYLDAKPTPWKLFLIHLAQSVQSDPRTMIEVDEQKFLALKYLVQAGADLETPLDHSIKDSNLTSRLSVDEIIRMITSREQHSILCRLLGERRNQNTAKASWLRWR